MAAPLLPNDDVRAPKQVGSNEQLPTDDPTVTDTEDGGAIVRVDDSPTQEPLSFYDNLATDETILDSAGLARIDALLRPAIEADKVVRELRDKQYAEAIQRTGIGDDAPGGAQFSGASRSVHPVLAKAAVDFAARTILELFPSGGPVRSHTVGTTTQQRVDKAERLSTHMNWQLTKQMPEFRAELEQLLSQVPLAGSQFLYGCWDEQLKRPRFTYWPSDKVYVPYAASSVMSAERVTLVEEITQRVYEQRVTSEYYREPATSAPSHTPDTSAAQDAAARGEGKDSDPYNEDGLRPIWRVFTYLDLDGKDPRSKGPAPYVIEMDADAIGGVKRVVRNWDQRDENQEPLRWLIEYPFLPWRGALSIGLGQAIGRLAGAATGALRALLDSAHVNNFPGMVKLKGANVVGQAQSVTVGTVLEMEGSNPMADNDIRKLLMPLPYNPPSPVLQQLLGEVVQECEGFVQTSMRNITEDNINQLPVGTALSAIEEGLRTLNAVHARLHYAMGHTLELLFRINKLYLDEQELKDETGEVLATRRDYQGPMDVQPVSDPNIFSEAQRYAQMQLVAQRQQLVPGIYDPRAVEEMILKRTRIPDYDKLLMPSQTAQPNNAATENVQLSMGRPVAAFPQQDHLAHLQMHLDYMNSPVLGQLEIIAPKFLNGVLGHIAEHLAMWYVNEVYNLANGAVKASGNDTELSELMDPKSHEVSAELDRLLATVSTDAISKAGQMFSKFPQIIATAQQRLQQLMPQPQPDPTLAATQMQVAAKQASDQAALQRAQITSSSAEKRTAMQTAAKGQGDQQSNVIKLQVAQTQSEAELQREREVQQHTDQRTQEDNATAMQIAAAEIAAGHRTNITTGSSVNKHEGT